MLGAALPGGLSEPVAHLTDADLDRLTADDLRSLSDEQLFAIQARRRAAAERRGEKCLRPLLTAEVLKNMNGEQLAALVARFRAEIEAQ